MNQTNSNSIGWRETTLIAVVAFSFVSMFFIPKFGQNPDYHNFADGRSLAGVPNFLDVMSNLAFLIVGFLGLRLCFIRRLSVEWFVLFAGIILVSAGSGYYHWSPNNATLVWDRLPMTIGFMGLFVALLAEHAGERLRALLIPLLLVGAASVLYWYYFDDLRFYAWVQAVPLLTVPLVLLLFPGKYSHRWLLLVALALYIGAKVTETFDRSIFASTGSTVSGHTIKHLLSAIGVLAIIVMLKSRRQTLPDPISD